MAERKFKFVSPGIFLDEIDNSALTALPDDIGPVVIGRSNKGPSMRPVKVDSFSDFVELFGSPNPGGGSDGDVWRNNAPLGPTHHIIDDWGALRNIPGIDIYCPSSVNAASEIITKIFYRNQPAYVRIPKGGFKLPESSNDMVFLAGEKRDILLISYGSIAQNCLAVQKTDSSFSVLVFN